MKILITILVIFISLLLILSSCKKGSENSKSDSGIDFKNDQDKENNENDKTDADSTDSVENGKKDNNIGEETQNSKFVPPERFEDLFPK